MKSAKTLVLVLVSLMILIGIVVIVNHIFNLSSQVINLQDTLVVSQEHVKQLTLERYSLLSTTLYQESMIDDKNTQLTQSQDRIKTLSRDLLAVQAEARQAIESKKSLERTLFCDSTNHQWSIQSVNEAESLLDDMNIWDLRVGRFQNFAIWSNSSARYFVVDAYDDSEEYGFPFLLFTGDHGWPKGLWDVTQQCWWSLEMNIYVTPGSSG